MADVKNPFLTTQDPQDGSSFEWLQGFIKSGAEAIPELIGITPSTDTLSWRQDNPIGGFISEFAGVAVPYTGWFKATQALGRFDRAINTIGDIATKPFMAGAAREAARFLPFEAGRVGVSQVVGDQPFTHMLGEASVNLALGSGIGGVLHGLAAAGRRDPGLSTIFGEGVDIAAPLSIQARQMQKAINSGELQGEMLDRAQMKLRETMRAARIEELPLREKYVGELDHVPTANHKELESQLETLFRPRGEDPDKIVKVQRFAKGLSRDFKTDQELQNAMTESALAPGFEANGQYFRHVSFNTTPDKAPAASKVAQTINDRLTKNMESVGNNTFLTREADDGMFILAKKVQGDAASGAPTDRWTLFKTDQPGMFVPDADRWAKIQVERSKWTPGANLSADGGEVYNSLRAFTQQFPLRNYMALAKSPGKVGETISKLLPRNMQGKDNELVQRLGEAFREYLVPRLHQFKQSWRGNWIVNATKATYDAAENLTQEILNGVVKIDPGKKLFFQDLRNDKTGVMGFQPVRALVNAIPEKDFQEQFGKLIWRQEYPVEKLAELQAQGLISPEVANFARNLNQVDSYVTGAVNKAESAVGLKPTEWRMGHYGLSRHWEGDTRVVLKNDAGEVVGLAGGANRRQAQAAAKALVQENPGWRIEGEYSLSQGQIPPDLAPVIKSPSFLLERQNMRGFKFDTKPFTREEFLEAYENALRGRMKYQANMATEDILGPTLERLARENPAVLRQVQDRMNDYAGVQGAFGRLQNKVADQILGPLLGPNSGSKIVQVTNTALFNFQLGALKLSYPIVNALQFVQTVVPEVAFVLGSAPAERLAGRYSYFAAGGSKGPVGAMGVLSPIKMMGQSFMEMKSPSAELSAAFERAVNDRVIDPRLVENYIGASATKVRDLRALGRGEIVPWLRAVSEFLPAETEKMSRTHAFTTGFITARDFLRAKDGSPLNPEQIYNFAKQFTENTMYLYSAADKPRVFTTPVGSVMGLFKNWMFHFMASMAEYAGEGVKHGNFMPLLWQTAGTFTLGGLAATPLWWTAEAFSKAWSNKTALQVAYDQFGDKGDAVMLGLPAAITGISLYSNVNTPLANPTRDAAQLFSVVAWDRAKQLGKLVGGAFDAWQTTGEHPGHSREVRDLMVRAFAPTTIYRSMAAAEPGQITQLGTGFPQIKNVSPGHRILYGLGFNPTEVDRGQAIGQELYTHHQKLKENIKDLGRNWANAEISKNSAQMAVIMRQAAVWGVDISKVLAEGMRQLRMQQQDIIERNLRPADYGAYRAAIQQHRGFEIPGEGEE